MPRRPYTVKCPHCGHPKATRAAARMKLKCFACDKGFRAPGDEEDLPVGQLAEPAPAAPPSDPLPFPAPAGSVVERARPVVGPPVVTELVDDDETSDLPVLDTTANADGDGAASAPGEAAKGSARESAPAPAPTTKASTWGRWTGRGR